MPDAENYDHKDISLLQTPDDAGATGRLSTRIPFHRREDISTSVAIVTGASSGIGRATALRLAKDFSAIVLAARGEGTLKAVAELVQAAGAEALVVNVDLSDPEAAETVVGQTLQRFGRIDALVNVAGAVPGLDVFDMTDVQWDAGLALKFHGAGRLTLRAWQALKDAKGSVIFVSGTAAETPKAASAAVGAINAAIEALAKAFADRGLADGIQVNSVSPGAIMTNRRLGMLEKAAATKGVSFEEAKRGFLAQAGVSRFGEPEEIAELMGYLVSPVARWMTGTVLRFDGGEVKSI